MWHAQRMKMPTHGIVDPCSSTEHDVPRVFAVLIHIVVAILEVLHQGARSIYFVHPPMHACDLMLQGCFVVCVAWLLQPLEVSPSVFSVSLNTHTMRCNRAFVFFPLIPSVFSLFLPLWFFLSWRWSRHQVTSYTPLFPFGSVSLAFPFPL